MYTEYYPRAPRMRALRFAFEPAAELLPFVFGGRVLLPFRKDDCWLRDGCGVPARDARRVVERPRGLVFSKRTGDLDAEARLSRDVLRRLLLLLLLLARVRLFFRVFSRTDLLEERERERVLERVLFVERPLLPEREREREREEDAAFLPLPLVFSRCAAKWS